MPVVTLEQARAAKQTVGKMLARERLEAAVGITRTEGGYAVKVNLTERPPDGAHLPKEVDGVPVKVEVTGIIRPR